MKRQRGRGRKPGGGGGGGGGGHNHGNRSLESSGPDVKIRGTAAQIYEKYAQYARDAQSGGDRVRYENFLQHAEHYYRVMAATMPRERLLQQQNGDGGLSSGQSTGEGEIGFGERAPMPGEPSEPMRLGDDARADESDDGDDGDDGDDAADEIEAGPADEGRAEAQGDRQGRGRRRRGRRRPHEGDQQERQGDRQAQGGSDTEARSALDSLARRQGAMAGG